jgi:hypothetical protein
MCQSALFLANPGILADGKLTHDRNIFSRRCHVNTGNKPQTDGFSVDYQHVPLMLAGSLHFDVLRRAINESASNPELNDVDVKIERACREYVSASEQERVAYRQRVANGWSLFHFAHRMVIRAMRTIDIGPLRLAAIAVSLEDGRNDPRDTVTCLAMLLHAASYVNADWDSLVEQTANISSPRPAELMREFASKNPWAEDLNAFLLCEGRDSNGPTIERIAP